MKAIFTKYHGATNTKGSRISASDEDGNRISISYPYGLSGEAVHRKAADALCERMKVDRQTRGWLASQRLRVRVRGRVAMKQPAATRSHPHS